MFVDRVKIQINAGKGGDGCPSFRREKFIPHGGPDGGDGGNGGSVIIEAEQGVNNLAALTHRFHWKAESGTAGSGANRHGRTAEDLLLLVPPGTVIIDAVAGHIIRDLVRSGDRVVAAIGGRGGKGNLHYKSSTNRAPRKFSKGQEGESRELILELKVIADVGLIGKPNAGKSTLLSRLSHARPEIASYPFTTRYPNLGMVQIDSERQFVLADLPGLIEGAHAGAGLGHEFLRHIERAGILVHLVEPTPMDGSNPLANYEAIRNELALYDANLAARPEIVVVSKAELPGAEEFRQRLAEALGRQPLLLSAVTGQGLDKLLQAIDDQLARERTPEGVP